MHEDEPDNGFEAGLRWVAQQLGRSAERLEEIDLEQVARDVGIDVERVQQYLDGAGQWLSRQAEGLADEAAARFGPGASGSGPEPWAPPPTGPHPLDHPTPAQGLALAAIDSGRWKVEAGSHTITTNEAGPAPAEAIGLVGELRVRDWIDSDGALTLLGRGALKRWVEPTA